MGGGGGASGGRGGGTVRLKGPATTIRDLNITPVDVIYLISARGWWVLCVHCTTLFMG